MKPQIIVVAHRRSGSHLTMAALANNFRGLESTVPHGEAFLEYMRGGDGSRLETIREAVEANSNVFYTHMHDLGIVDQYFGNTPEAADVVKQIFDNSKLLYVTRDGRDMLASMYPWMQAKGHGNIADATSFGDFIRQDNEWDHEAYEGDFNRPSFWRYHIENWSKHSDVLSMSFEDYQENYEECLQRIEAHIGFQPTAELVDVRRKQVMQALPDGNWMRRFRKYLINPIMGIKDQAEYFRSGTVGDYANIFEQQDLDFFRSEAGEMMESLGYSL